MEQIKKGCSKNETALYMSLIYVAFQLADDWYFGIGFSV